MGFWQTLFPRLTERRARAIAPATASPVDGRAGRSGGWFPVVRESYAGAWQQNIEIRAETVLAHAAVYACVTLIASDIGKLRVRLVEQDAEGIWHETENTAHSPVLKRPNHYQNRIKFYEQWIVSKLIHGNTYIVKQRDLRGVVTALYILDPTCVRPLVAPDGGVYYEVRRDYLSQVTEETVVVPQSEIIHDVMVPLYHPLCGVSPIYACGISAVQGLRIENNAARFFANNAVPSGILTAPGFISEEDLELNKARWMEAYSGDNYGQVAHLGNGLTFEKMAMSATDSQLIEQLKWTGENACTAFHVPPFMIGLAPAPTNSNPESIQIQYYSQCLQNLLECIELLLDQGLELEETKNAAGRPIGTEFDLDDLIRMDTATKVKASADAIKGGGMAPNEARARYLDLGPVLGGESPYLQQQNYSLAALAKRDAQADPFGKAPVPEPPPSPDTAPPNGEAMTGARTWLAKYFGVAA